MEIHNIWMVTREYGSIAGAGGVKDVVAQLSAALAVEGRAVNVVLPMYGCIDAEALGAQPLHGPSSPLPVQFSIDMNYTSEDRKETVQVYTCAKDGVRIYLIDSPRFSEKGDVYTYTLEEEQTNPDQRRGVGHFDYFAMNVLLQKAALQLIMYLGEKPDVIHCHDGHTAILPAMVREISWLDSYFKGCGLVITVHNAGRGYHQEVDDLSFARAITSLPKQVVYQSRLDGSFDPFVAGAGYAFVNTVSENYARELQETDEDERTGWLGHHLLAMGCHLEGITNGIDPVSFNPRNGKKIGIASNYNPRAGGHMKGKMVCKKDLKTLASTGGIYKGVQRSGFLDSDRDVPLFTFVGRFTPQKGVDIVAGALQKYLRERKDFQCLVMGNGMVEVEESIEALTQLEEARGRVCFFKGYNPELANKVYSGGDFFMIPSHYEPCGLTDFIAQLFGNLPIVHHVGGLVKVIDGTTGFAYHHNSPDGLAAAMDRALACWHNKSKVRTMQKDAIALIDERYNWSTVKTQYLELYARAKQK